VTSSSPGRTAPRDREWRAGDHRSLRVLYSFPHRIGAGRICDTAWHQATGLAAEGIEVTVFPGAVARKLPGAASVLPTLARGPFRVSYRALGDRRALRVHDRIVARRLPSLAGKIDLIHAWPSGALGTLAVARRLGIPTVLERPNAHTRLAYDLVNRESERLGVPLPPGSEHAFDTKVLAWEEEEFQLADALLCPSEFVRRSFIDEGFDPTTLLRHSYGFDDQRFHQADGTRESRPFTALFAGVAAVRKGLHLALEAWRRSSASRDGVFLVAGSFLPAYREKLAPLLAHPSIRVLGHRSDIPELMRASDILLLPSIEEGSPLVAMEALGSGCVPLVSEVCAGPCRHLENALLHRVGDVEALSDQISLVHDDAASLVRLRAAAVASAPEFTWKAAARRLVAAYELLLGRTSEAPMIRRESSLGRVGR